MATRFHDHRLAGYVVGEFGKRITLNLEYHPPGVPRQVSAIEFSEVAAYQFIHTGSAILADIREVPLADLLRDIGGSLAECWREHGGYVHWNDDREAYRASLEGKGYRAWNLTSAVGFAGFIIAKRVALGAPDPSPPAPPAPEPPASMRPFSSTTTLTLIRTRGRMSAVCAPSARMISIARQEPDSEAITCLTRLSLDRA